jgi:hypothetical protein
MIVNNFKVFKKKNRYIIKKDNNELVKHRAGKSATFKNISEAVRIAEDMQRDNHSTAKEFFI